MKPPPITAVCWHPAPAATPDVNRTGFITCAPRLNPAARTGDESASAGKDHGRTRAQLRILIREVRRHRPRHVEGRSLRDRPAPGLARCVARLEAQRRRRSRGPSRARATKRRCAPSATLLNELGLTEELVGIGHRVVHGGSKFSGSMAITPEVIAKVEECIPLGPLHNPPNLVGIRIAQELFPDAAAGGRLRHRVPPDDAAGGVHLPGPARVARDARRAALRVPRHQPPLRGEAGAAR